MAANDFRDPQGRARGGPNYTGSTMQNIAAGRALIVVLILMASGCKPARPTAPAMHIRITAHKYGFEPSVIHLKQGEAVELEISTLDVQHGFEVKGLGLDESVQKGRPAIVTFTAQRKGEYRMNCDIICGPGHDNMEGKIVVD
jgi:cytochrome c oxidase subunit 2